MNLEPRRNTDHCDLWRGGGNMTSPPLLYVTAANIGHQPLTLTGIPSLVLPDTQKLVLTGGGSDAQLPHELLPGKSLNYWSNMKQLARELKQHGYSGTLEVVGEFGDAVGNKYKSKPFQFDLEDWAK